MIVDWEAYTINKLYVDWQELLLGQNKHPHPIFMSGNNITYFWTTKMMHVTINWSRGMYLIEDADYEYPYDTYATIDNNNKFVTDRFVPDKWESDTLTINMGWEDWFYELHLINEEGKRIYNTAFVQWETVISREKYPTAKYYFLNFKYQTWIQAKTAMTDLSMLPLTITK